jgi:hypothetical protein
MKVLRTLSGIKKIESEDKEVIIFQVRDILNEQRKLLINRMLSDLHAYVDYKFGIRADSDQMELIKEKLESMRHYSVDMERYSDIVQHVLEHDRTHINAEPFYKEIDENIHGFLADIPLKLIK